MEALQLARAPDPAELAVVAAAERQEPAARSSSWEAPEASGDRESSPQVGPSWSLVRPSQAVR